MSGFVTFLMVVGVIVLIVRKFSSYQARQSQLTRNIPSRAHRPQPRVAGQSQLPAKGPTQTGQPFVLIIDDEAHTTIKLSSAFRQRGIGVVVENRGGLAGLEALRHHRPALIVIAVELPDILGYEVCKRLKINPAVSEIPVFLISSTATQAIFDNHAKLKTHADEYMFKPVDAADLVAKAAFYIETSLSSDVSTKPKQTAAKSDNEPTPDLPPPPSPSSDAPPARSRVAKENRSSQQTKTGTDLADLAKRLSSAAFNEGQSIEDSLQGCVFNVELVIQRVERTSILESSAKLAGGRTATGTTKSGDVPLIVRFPAADNDRIDALSRGDTLSVRGVFHDYESLFDRFVLTVGGDG